jgi:hypothetical protein
MRKAAAHPVVPAKGRKRAATSELPEAEVEADSDSKQPAPATTKSKPKPIAKNVPKAVGPLPTPKQSKPKAPKTVKACHCSASCWHLRTPLAHYAQVAEESDSDLPVARKGSAVHGPTAGAVSVSGSVHNLSINNSGAVTQKSTANPAGTVSPLDLVRPSAAATSAAVPLDSPSPTSVAPSSLATSGPPRDSAQLIVKESTRRRTASSS